MNELLYIDEQFPSYQIIEMLSDNPTSRAFLAERGDTLYVIKEQPKALCFLKNPAMLCELECPGLPKIVDFYENDESFFYSYEYIKGVTLTEAYESGLITTSAAVSITEKLCGIVSYLHEKSLLHCDIKPDNILIHGNEVFLIDFGIARVYDKNDGGETAVIGTAGFVTPELGYKKTDYRADVYALGMVLYYLLTGSADIKKLPEAVSDKRLRAIINRAANYEVAKRYKTVAKFQNALGKYVKGTAYRPLFITILAAGFILCFIAGCLISPIVSERLTAYFGTTQTPVYVFSDPLIEQAIRISLGKTADEPVYANELLSVEQLYMMGDQAFASTDEQEAYRNSLLEVNKTPPYARFISFDDITACENLKKLHIQYNVLDNIDFLDGNRFLEELKLVNTNVTDIAPIKNLPQLFYLCLDDCPINDLSPIQDCLKLEQLTLYHINAVNYDFVTPGKRYPDIAISSVHYEKFMQHLSGMTVRRLAVLHCDIPSLDVFPDMTITEVLDIRHNNLTDADGSERILADGAEIIW
ncbi:MAG: protein kinase [Oscillospiraceae bacterium]|jgi:hypothetical protein|nr:protein kinase [Oscillospiraceae bacterium]